MTLLQFASISIFPPKFPTIHPSNKHCPQIPAFKYILPIHLLFIITKLATQHVGPETTTA
jgi:hypothetical protein